MESRIVKSEGDYINIFFYFFRIVIKFWAELFNIWILIESILVNIIFFFVGNFFVYVRWFVGVVVVYILRFGFLGWVKDLDIFFIFYVGLDLY